MRNLVRCAFPDPPAAHLVGTVARGRQVDDYYFHTVHYLEPGHALAGRTVATYLLRNGLAAP